MVNQLFVSTVTKAGGAKAGISLLDTPNGVAVIVSRIAPDGYFQGTSLQVGHMILTVNGVSAKGRTALELSQVIGDADGQLKIVSTGVPPGAPAGGMWGYQKYGSGSGDRFNVAALQYRRLYSSPDGHWYLENGSIRKAKGPVHQYEGPGLESTFAGFAFGKFKPHEAWYEEYLKGAINRPRGSTVVPSASSTSALLTSNAIPISQPAGNTRKELPLATVTAITQSTVHLLDEVPVADATELNIVPVTQPTVAQAIVTAAAPRIPEPTVAQDGTIWV